MNRLFVIIIIIGVAVGVCAQERTVQNKPYIDLRPMHFGILVGFHAQDIEFKNVGPQTFVAEDGTVYGHIISPFTGKPASKGLV